MVSITAQYCDHRSVNENYTFVKIIALIKLRIGKLFHFQTKPCNPFDDILLLEKGRAIEETYMLPLKKIASSKSKK